MTICSIKQSKYTVATLIIGRGKNPQIVRQTSRICMQRDNTEEPNGLLRTNDGNIDKNRA
jgi:hypothetical protein